MKLSWSTFSPLSSTVVVLCKKVNWNDFRINILLVVFVVSHDRWNFSWIVRIFLHVLHNEWRRCCSSWFLSASERVKKLKIVQIFNQNSRQHWQQLHFPTLSFYPPCTFLPCEKIPSVNLLNIWTAPSSSFVFSQHWTPAALKLQMISQSNLLLLLSVHRTMGKIRGNSWAENGRKRQAIESLGQEI